MQVPHPNFRSPGSITPSGLTPRCSFPRVTDAPPLLDHLVFHWTHPISFLSLNFVFMPFSLQGMLFWLSDLSWWNSTHFHQVFDPLSSSVICSWDLSWSFPAPPPSFELPGCVYFHACDNILFCFNKKRSVPNNEELEISHRFWLNLFTIPWKIWIHTDAPKRV